MTGLAHTCDYYLTSAVTNQFNYFNKSIIEGIFKALGRALRQACAIDEEYADEIPSTKGVL